MGVSQMNLLIGKLYLKTKLCIDVLHTSEIIAIFVKNFAYFGQNLLAMATSLRPLQPRIYSLVFGLSDPVISPHILVTSRRNAFIAIFVPQLVAMVTPFVRCLRECHR